MTNKDKAFLTELKETGEYYSMPGATEEMNNTLNFMVWAVRNNAEEEINELKRQIAVHVDYIKCFKDDLVEFTSKSTDLIEKIKWDHLS